ncbi:xyloside xylosyltransferase 1 isoform X2 [Eurytemora carolleeae]|uniref:xyloside xylosyltransferase 1 isoform X2 n=1 Tax=Eurytemora carolleeae TaxID=1294199 RepID=UPI000C7594F3|nr:xyloside xylosyltransferase 1 isoform X2 [Eurytemora carolleeae]|eukprot:XP_023345198.1 xyloside xylosyltransferase 1-like isoform X2 [Eurytemora affinis]
MKKYFGLQGKAENLEEVNEDGFKTVYVYHTKYIQDLFYIGPMYHLEYPDAIKILLVLDVDLEFNELIGVGPELTRYYRLRAASFIQENPGSSVGQPGKWQGFNTGVVIYNLKNIRESQLFNQLINPEFYKMATTKYFYGGLGDQDLFTLMGWEYSELFYNLPCQYNYQTYRDIDYTQFSLELDVKNDDPEYRNCKNQGKVIHVNGLII